MLSLLRKEARFRFGIALLCLYIPIFRIMRLWAGILSFLMGYVLHETHYVRLQSGSIKPYFPSFLR